MCVCGGGGGVGGGGGGGGGGGMGGWVGMSGWSVYCLCVGVGGTDVTVSSSNHIIITVHIIIMHCMLLLWGCLYKIIIFGYNSLHRS